jgi:NADH-ubiquinone oxidoreductase chain 6
MWFWNEVGIAPPGTPTALVGLRRFNCVGWWGSRPPTWWGYCPPLCSFDRSEVGGERTQSVGSLHFPPQSVGSLHFPPQSVGSLHHSPTIFATPANQINRNMTIETILFSLFSSIALISGLMVIRAKNPIHSVLFLILVFCNVSGLLVLLGVEFFAMIFLVVYVGAIAVLFLFVVMMLNIKIAEMHENVIRYLPVGGVVGLIFLFEIFLVVENDFIPVFQFKTSTAHSALNFEMFANKVQSIPNIEAIGQILYTHSFYLFIVASLILLVAMIGAIVLTMHKSTLVKRQEVFKQNAIDFAKTIYKIRS